MDQEQQQIMQQLQQRLAQLENVQAQPVFGLQELAETLRPRHQVKPRKFDGKRDVRKFLTTFEEARDVNNWNAQQTAIELKLALDDRVSESVQGQTYAELREFLLNRYELTEDDAYTELKSLRLRKGDNIFEYGDRLLKLIRVTNPGLNAHQQEVIAIRELRESVGDWRLKHDWRSTPPENFAEALRKVQQFNSDKGERTSIHKITALTDDESEVTKVETDVVKLKADMAALKTEVTDMQKLVTASQKEIMTAIGQIGQQPAAAQPGPSRESRSCYHCNKVGHLARDCYLKRNDSVNSYRSKAPGNDQGRRA